jgi:hypothetical protein
MAKKKAPTDPLAANRELFCQYYAKNSEMFGNATHSYGEAFGYELDTLSQEGIYSTDEDGKPILVEKSPYDRACSVCATEGARLLRNPQIQARITVLLNELLKDDVVDGELAKIIQQNHDLPSKIRAINEYNKVRGRILDRTRVEHERFDVDDIRAILSVLPQERQDQVYAIITAAIEEAELLRGGQQVQVSSTQ